MPSGSADFAEIAMTTRRMRVLMSSALAGMLKYIAAGIAEGRA
jgi:hypothetical protein